MTYNVVTLCIDCNKIFHIVYVLDMIQVETDDDTESTIKTIIPLPSFFKIDFNFFTHKGV